MSVCVSDACARPSIHKRQANQWTDRLREEAGGGVSEWRGLSVLLASFCGSFSFSLDPAFEVTGNGMRCSFVAGEKEMHSQPGIKDRPDCLFVSILSVHLSSSCP